LIFPYKHFHKNLLFSIDGVSKLWFDMMRNGTTLYSGSAPASNRAREHGMQQDFATFFEVATGHRHCQAWRWQLIEGNHPAMKQGW
jgi:glucose/arabinose dehydrogenase